MKKLLMLALLLTSGLSYGQLLKVSLTCTGGALSQSDCDRMAADMQNSVNDQGVPESNINDYTTSMAEAISISTAGQGSDYANLFDIFVLSINPIAVGASVDLNNLDNADSGGVALSPAMTLGVNLDVLPVDKIAGVELKDFDLFFSYFSQKNDKLLDEDGTTIGGEITNFATHVRYKWKPGASALGGLFAWNGVQLHTGYRFAKNKLDARFDITDIDPIDLDADGDGTNDFQMNINNAFASASIESTSHTIPVEISTAARVLYLFTFYSGLGFDYNLKSESEIGVNTGGTIASEANAGGTGTTVSGSIAAGESATGDGSATNFRGFFGVQANLWALKVGAQVQKSLSNDTLAVNVGAKIAW